MDLRPRWDRSAAAAIATLLAGFAIGASGFIRHLRQVASDNNALMLEVARRQAEGKAPGGIGEGAAMFMTSLAPLTFVIATPLGWLSAYLVVTGLVRSVAASVREPRGDPLIGLATRLWTRGRTRRAQARDLAARRALEGPEVMDRLATAARFGLAGAELVVVASRPKPEWTPGTVLDCGGRHFEVGPAVERTLPGGLRTLYPLKPTPGAGVFRRVVRYDLPALQPDPTKG